MLSEAPPCLLLVTTSLTCLELMDVNTLTSSGMIAPASVPQVMMVESFHHIVASLPSVGMSRCEMKYVKAMEMIDVSHTSDVSGASKLNLSAFLYLADANAPLIQ